MAAVEVMDGATVRRWFLLSADALASTRAAIDLLNVFPVPDADTGRNLHATITSAAAALADLPPHASPAETWQVATTAALRGACGNSGIILSQLLRGLADICAPASPCDGSVVAMALTHAAAAARAAVRRPVEGTVLTVADAAAQAASQASGLAEVCRAAAAGAREALARTQQQLEALTARGVVDAGAAGLCVLLDALCAAISGTHPDAYEVPEPLPGSAPAGRPGQTQEPPGAPAPFSPHAYEVTFLLDAADDAVASLADHLDQLGDSLVVSGGGGQWHVHVHVADAGAVIEAGVAAGRPSRISVTYLNVLPAGPAGTPAGPAGTPAGPATAVVAVADGPGLRDLLGAAGAVVAAAAGAASPEPSLADLAAGPGPRTLIGSADLAPRWPAGWPVVEIASPVQAIAAVAVHDPQRDRQTDATAMRRAVAGMRWASVSGPEVPVPAQAGGGSSPPAGNTGVLVGRVCGEVVATGVDQFGVVAEVIGRLLGPGTELITIVAGVAAGPDLPARAAGHAASLAPDADVTCYRGGMTGAVLLVGAE